MAKPVIEFTIDQKALQALGRALNAEADGKKLRRELAANMRKAAEPAKQEVRSAVLGIHGGGLPHEGEPLRAGVAGSTKVEARLTGRSTGVRVRMPKKAVPRFPNAAKRLNKNTFRHPVFGNRKVWVTQEGKLHYFEEAVLSRRDACREAVMDAMNDMAGRIAGSK